MRDALTADIEWLTRGVRAIRIGYQLRKAKEQEMARLIEIKGLGDAVAGAKRGIADLKTATGKLNTSTGMLVAEVNDLTEQVEQHRQDLRFEAETLGNGNGGGSDEQSEMPSQQPPQDQQTASPPPVPGDQRRFDRLG